MLRITVATAVMEKAGTTREGKSYLIRYQEADVHLPGKRHPQTIEIRVPDNSGGYAKGEYTLSAHSFYVGRYNKLECNPTLEPVAKKAVG